MRIVNGEGMRGARKGMWGRVLMGWEWEEQERVGRVKVLMVKD